MSIKVVWAIIENLMNEDAKPTRSLDQLFASHPRLWQDFEYVYPVLSRRSGGLSIGVNLNIDKICNFHCVYCQVDTHVAPVRVDVDLDQLGRELDWLCGFAASGGIWEVEPFAGAPAKLHRVNDIAFSGDGEPTTFGGFEEACRIASEMKTKHGLEDVKLVTLSNMTMAHKENVQRGLGILEANGGELWAKLDAGTDDYYAKVDRSGVKLDRIVENILLSGKRHPLAIQSLLMRLHGEATPVAEFEAYLDRVGQLLEGGCQIKLVQLYTIARDTAESYATPLTKAELDDLAARFTARFPQTEVDVYYGVGD